MLNSLIGGLVHSPLYPHWLEHRKMKQGDKVILKGLKGDVLEVGAGDGMKKIEILRDCPKIKTYLATDYSSWDKEFDSFTKVSSKFGKLGEIFMGRQARAKLDDVCSATKLPYKSGRFDAHLSFEVLEHVEDPFAYFSEAARVVKPGGKIILSIPFLYREHVMDYFRYTTGFFDLMAKKNKLKVSQVYCNTGIGTTVTTLANQWLVRRILESPAIFKPVLLLISPFFFLFNNVLGWLVDIKPDKRFATRYHLVFQKK